ncbi:uncharacterized protein SCHCODRAFT_02617265 [Schizophyllum commune H4-8]|uniref:uncharacterized protein n=1 Tax=Schizophyllum commune (strain H4-8 / FGSC 9210) TaxID=578458 RepID=UPI00215FE87E|nr:uncharacterized protein SCHCODRAFT_02617265 [Schizophyllum commune H4-8]KAI5894561.1 hypothetical protein SCHCODRAFT_02617265 [Schizophyllum commune H4-8]
MSSPPAAASCFLLHCSASCLTPQLPLLLVGLALINNTDTSESETGQRRRRARRAQAQDDSERARPPGTSAEEG